MGHGQVAVDVGVQRVQVSVRLVEVSENVATLDGGCGTRDA